MVKKEDVLNELGHIFNALSYSPTVTPNMVKYLEKSGLVTQDDGLVFVSEIGEQLLDKNQLEKTPEFDDITEYMKEEENEY